jgi:superfamily I DNA and RNA helicase
MITIIRGATRKPVASQRLADFCNSQPQLTGTLYLGYPVIGTPDGAFPIDAIWVNEKKGIVIFNLVEGKDVVGYDELQDDSANKLEAKLRNHRTLMKGRELLIKVGVITFAPIGAKGAEHVDGYALANDETLLECINSIPDSTQAYAEAVAVVQSISTIRKGVKKRTISKADSRGARLKALEDSIANLDNLQGRAVIETVDGVQRIRGLAGSGKTIVLALKAAYLHAQHPDWKIAVTFHTRALKGQFRRLINTFHIEQTNEEPDWNNLQVINSWGAPGSSERNGIYYSFCKQASVEYFDLTGAKVKFNQGYEFEGVCEQALKDATSDVEPIYDAILVDEAQDLSPAFLRICYRLLTKNKRLVYAYDELQNLGSSSLPPPEDIFGEDASGHPLVSFAAPADGAPQQDIILEKCYRNSRPVLATAHALGFGIYRTPPAGATTGLIQMFDQSSLWLDVGYTIKSGQLSDGKVVRLSRTEASSPKFLEHVSDDVDDLIQFHSFGSTEEQNRWLASEIKSNLSNDELQPNDIIVINPDPLSTKSVVGPIRKYLFTEGVATHLAGVDTSPDIFFDDDGKSVAFTGIFRAKGNEAGMVYIINAQDCYSSWGSLARVRNQLFTAITRSKAWVRVLGVGENMAKLINEFDQVKSQNFELDFRYPTAQEREKLNIVNRDKDVSLIRQGATNLGQLIEDMNAGRIFVEDLPADQVELLRSLLSKGENS